MRMIIVLVMNIMKIMMIIVMSKATTVTPAPNKLLVMIIMKILRVWRCYLASSGDHDDRSVGGDDDIDSRFDLFNYDDMMMTSNLAFGLFNQPRGSLRYA